MSYKLNQRFFEDIKDNVEKRFDTSNYEAESSCLISRRIWKGQGQSWKKY